MINLIKYSEKYKLELKHFIEHNYSSNHPLLNDELFYWQYLNSEIYLYLDNDRIVGFNNYIKTKYQYKKNIIDSLQFAMSKVINKYNGLDIIIEAHKNYKIICGMGFNRDTILPILKGLNYKIIDPISRLYIDLKQKNSTIELDSNIINIVDCKKLEDLWINSTKDTNIFSIYRNESFWKWRYINNPPFKNNEKYKFYGNYNIGIIVFRREKYLNTFVIRIVEIVPYKNNIWNGNNDVYFNNLIKKFCNWVFDNKINIIDFYCTHKNLLDSLEKLGFNKCNNQITNNFENPKKSYSELNYVLYFENDVNIDDIYETKSCGDMDRPDGLIYSKEISINKISILSSINIDTIKDKLHKNIGKFIKNIDIHTYEYGQLQQNFIFEDSELYKQNPEFIFIIDRPEDIINKSLDEYEDNDSEKVITYFNSIKSYVKVNPNVTIFIMEYFLTEKTVNFNCISDNILNIFQENLNLLKDEYKLNINIMKVQNIKEGEILDKRMWYIGKIPYTDKFINKLASKITGLILSMKGLTARLLVLDLDNTLWGGVVGEDGVHGIKIGEDYPGNIFKEFQKKIKLLKERGIALAICSKNDINIVNEVFEKNKNMILKKEDFVYIYANWDNKFENIKLISDNIGLGLKNILFIDDNPVEREQVKEFLPDVNVLELSKDPVDYIDNLLNSPLLEIHKLTESDKKRAKTYETKVKLDNLEKKYVNKEDFYKQLDLEIFINILSNDNKDRCVQLINKTNQFNATSLRLKETDLSKYKIYVLGAKDKFNDYENMGVLITTEIDNIIKINNYLMSCRFLGKNLENEFIKWLLNYAKNNNFNKVTGKIIETERNEPIRNIYKNNNFILEDDLFVYNLDNINIEMKEYIKLHDNTNNEIELNLESTNQNLVKNDNYVDLNKINNKILNVIKSIIDDDAIKIFDELIKNNKLDDDINYIPSWSSLKHIILINKLEDTFKIKISIDQIIKIKTITDLNKLIE